MFGTPNISLLEIKTAFDLAFAHFVSIWVITCYNSHQYLVIMVFTVFVLLFLIIFPALFFAVLSPYIFLPWPLGGCSFVCSFLRDFSALLLLLRCWVAGWADVTIVYCVETATDHSCYISRIGNCNQGFLWYYFQWPWTTANQISRSRHYSTLNISETIEYRWVYPARHFGSIGCSFYRCNF